MSDIAEAVDTAPEITKESLDEKPSDAPKVSDRESLSPSIREFIRAQQPAPEPEGLEREVRELRAALDSLAQPKQAQLTEQEQILQELRSLQQREAERIQQQEQQAQQLSYEQQLEELTTGAIENINAQKENFPGLVALEQQEIVVNALFERLADGQETSEDVVAGEVEQGLREVYEKLHAVYGSVSEDQSRAGEPARTLTPTLQGVDTPTSTDTLSREERIEALWNKFNR